MHHNNGRAGSVYRLGLTTLRPQVILITMWRTSTITRLLREALAEAESLNSVARATGVQKASLIRFLRGSQSLRLDIADKLVAHFDIECRRPRRKRKG
jgi:hypothetical protein